MTPTLIHAANPGPFTGEGNWTYLIGGDRPLLIDAGAGHAAHLDAIAALVPEGTADVLVTHAHSDHTDGVPAILARWPATRFHKFPWPARDKHVQWRPLSDGDMFETAEGALETIHTPGHSPDHVAFWHAPSRSVFVGDLLVFGGTVFIPASSGGNLTHYLESLQRLLRLEPVRAWPAHGPPIEDPAALIHQYLDHRRQREAQVIDALESGLRSVDDITARIYSNLAPTLAPMARESVRAHLHKLEAEGGACREGDGWLLVR